MKKLLSVFLVAMMVFSVFAISASAATHAESESNDTFATADTFIMNSTMKGSMGTSNDVDFYKIVAPSNGKLSLVFKHDFIDSDNGWDVYVYFYNDGNYNELSAISIKLKDGEKTNLSSLGVVKNGVYYVKIGCRTTGIPLSDYTVSTSFDSTNYYEKEMNDTFQTSTEIILNKAYSGVTSNWRRGDFFKIIAPSNAELTVTFKHTYRDSYDGWNVSVYTYENGAYVELSSKRISLYDSEKIDLPIINAEKNKDYYVKVSQLFTSILYDEYQVVATMPGSSSTTYMLSYNANGGSGAPSSQIGKTTYTISSTEPTRSGYNFLGWSTSSSSSYATYEPGDKITLSKNTTLYAVWEETSSGNVDTGSVDINIDIVGFFAMIGDFFVSIFNFIMSLFA